MKQPILSIVIPMYNCCRTIVRCLRSIDASDAEIIVVNDGSTDDSQRVVEEYIRLKNDEDRDIKNNRILLLNKPNGGVSSARNIGIENAQGKYICFVDADDYHAAEGLDRIIEIAESENADIVTYDACVVNERDIPVILPSVKTYSISKRIYSGRGEAFKTNLIPDYVCWDAVYRLSIIKDNSIRFRTDLVFREDDEFKGHFYCYTEKIVVTDLPLYNYVTDSSSSSTGTKNKRRTIIDSALRSIASRQQNVKENFAEDFPLERLKFMRYVCMPSDAMSAQYTLKEYKTVLDRFRALDCYPLEYEWIRVAQWTGYSWRYWKLVFKTFLTNHPSLAYLVYRCKK